MSTPVDDFFVQFISLGFNYRASRTAFNNFKRLCKTFGWEKRCEEFETAKWQFHNALVQQFDVTFGSGVSLKSWQKLCSVIDITPTPESITQCRQCTRAVYVNIFDLIEAGRTGKQVQKFDTLEQLRKHTLRTEKIFPKEKARFKGLLRDLLREILDPQSGKGRGGGKRRKRKARKQAAAAQPSS